MNSKNTDKRITHLDLKFLDLSILAVDTKLPDSSSLIQNRKQTKISNSKKQTTWQMSKCQRIEDDTADVTTFQQPSLYYKSQQNKSLINEYKKPQILNYLSADISDIHNECSKKIHQKSKALTMKISQNKNLLLSKKQPQDESIMMQISKYDKAAKRIESQNSCIHKEIAKLYFANEFELRSKNKNIKTMVIKNDEDSAQTANKLKSKIAILSKEYMKENNVMNSTAMIEFNKYMTDLEQEFSYGKANSPHHQQYQIERQLCAVSKQKIKPKDKMNTSSIGKKVQLLMKAYPQHPNVAKEDQMKKFQQNYSNFYENLFDQKRKTNTKSPNVPLASYKKGHKSMIQHSEMLNSYQEQAEGGKQQIFESLRKKIINGNIDRSLQLFLNEKKMRIPGFLKNLR